MSTIVGCSRRMFFYILILFCGFANYATGNRDEYFSSVSGLEKLLTVESEVLNDLQHYISSLQTHIDWLQSELDSIRFEHQTAADDVDGYLSNPVNAYRLIKRLHTDWRSIEDIVREDHAQMDFLNTMEANRRRFDFPTTVDIEGAAAALVRLQGTYKLDVGDLAGGVLNGMKYGASMTWQDCFILGHHLFEMNDFNHTITWLKQSVQLLKEQEYNPDPRTLDFLETVVAYHLEMGDLETALELVNHILATDATREHMFDTKLHLQLMISDGVKTGLLHETVSPPGDYHLTNDFKLYEQVCRGELHLTAAEERHLRCRFDSNNVPYRLLQPFKVEELSLDPRIVQIHDVISESDTSAVKRLAKVRMSRSQVRNINGTPASTANYRISKSAWFSYEESRHMRKIQRYMGDLSGLNMANAEHLQVANYGIGGHYEPHFDFFTDNSTFSPSVGNRLATGIFYLSDVEEGGGTAFPYLRLLVKPQHGSVLFWYNLHRSEEPDYRTRHAACPVLKGSKWIANIWVRARHQDLQRPCDIVPDHEVSLKYKDLH
ncbi:PREDICTED: prolyl 4-hydroxylase subunit alpha-2-like [Rhagoletis zephyria]|uniref:prolyl 4-hydroxylase subunit alpha-2-like n=1 Tax=Rhagoletis zephyria TaxID=28612 RepID=UPI0008119685|nr:PREDICTED: prolyl 4-hydroxylase subunit alpha-2-like [Rhagoletis zephyria]